MKKNRHCRRTFLQGLGLGAGFLPLLSSEAPAQSTATGFPKRLIVITWTNGIVPAQFYPAAGPLTAALPNILAPLEPYKSKVLAMRMANSAKSPIDMQVMIDANQTYNGHQSYPALLTGTWRSGTASDGPSIDQLIANHLQTQGVAQPLLNLGARPYSSSTSWRAAGQKNTAQTDPYRLLSTLFAGVPTTPGMMPEPPTTGGGPSTADALRLRRRSVLDFVGTELERFSTRLGTEDRAKVQSHLEAVRELENRQGTGGTGGTGGTPTGTYCAAPALPATKPNYNQIANYPAHVSATLAVAAAAVKCDKARCITIDLIDDGGGNSLTFPWLDINSPDYHAIAHAGSGSYTQKASIARWYYEQIAVMVRDLANTPEGTGSALDNTCILVANDMNEGANHYVGNIPYLIIGSCGGFFKQGECVSFARNVPHNHFLTTICHAMGLDIAQVGTNYSGNVDALLRA
jgi:hypothetical protein